MRMTKIATGLLCGALLFCSVPAGADGMEYTITPFFWGSSLDGSIAVGPAAGDIDVGFSDLLDNLEFAVPINFQAKGGKWALIAEINYVALGGDLEVNGPRGAVRQLGKYDVDMLIFELLSAWEFSNFGEVLFGVRYQDIDVGLELFAPTLVSQKFNDNQDWIDPVVGIRYGGPISRTWEYHIRADAAGFGLGSGSDLTINLRAGFGVKFSDKVAFLFGWHAYDVDFENQDLTYDMLQQGPELGLRISF